MCVYILKNYILLSYFFKCRYIKVYVVFTCILNLLNCPMGNYQHPLNNVNNFFFFYNFVLLLLISGCFFSQTINNYVNNHLKSGFFETIKYQKSINNQQ